MDPEDSEVPPETATDDSPVDTGESAPLDTGDSEVPLAEPCPAYGPSVEMGVVADTALDELSGIAASRAHPDVLWVHEDHLGAAAVYALDPAGTLLATVNLVDAENNDWEDIALAPCGDVDCLYVGEIGNNDSDREGLGVYRFPEPDPAGAVDGVIDVDWEFFGFVYPDENQNSEALAVTADGLPVIFTKRYDDELSRVYVFPSMNADVEVALDTLGAFVTSDDPESDGIAAVTAADLWPDDQRLIVRTYGRIFELPIDGDLAAAADAPRTDVLGPPEVHGEAIGYDAARRGFWQVAEAVNPTLWFTGCAEGE